MPALTRDQLDHFEEHGYVVVDDLLDQATEVRPLVDEYDALIDDLCQRLHAEGKLASSYRGMSFGERLTRILEEAGQSYYQHLDISLGGPITEETPIHLGPAVFRILTSPRLLDAAESVVGPELYSNPIQHIRIKVPERLVPEPHRNSLTATTEWHQDQGVALPEADQTDTLTVWLAITDATVENGCLQVIPGSHREDLAVHCPGGGRKNQVHIPDAFLRLGDAVPAPVRSGGALFMHRRTKHASLANCGDDIRWSFDLRYCPIGQPTGRPWFPGFVARSQRDPASVLSDPAAWARLWVDARARLARGERPSTYRWSADAPACA
jgi:phytanoyl-CoA hydroxylase